MQVSATFPCCTFGVRPLVEVVRLQIGASSACTRVTLAKAAMAQPRVLSMLVLDSDGRRIAVKYFGSEFSHNVQAQANYEKAVWNKTSRTNARGEGRLPGLSHVEEHVQWRL